MVNEIKRPMDYEVTRYHLLVAVQALCADADDIGERLRAAHARALSRIDRLGGVPDELRPAFDDLMGQLSAIFGSANANQGWAARLAREIVLLHRRLNEYAAGRQS